MKITVNWLAATSMVSKKKYFYLSIDIQSIIARALDNDKHMLMASLNLSSVFDVNHSKTELCILYKSICLHCIWQYYNL
jgi:hypothetical protein